MQSIPRQMKAAAIDQFGGPEVLHAETLPVPTPGPTQVLIRLESAGIGVWDPYVRTGELAGELGKGGFPRVIGNDGAGEVVAVGDRVKRFKPGDQVYAFGLEGGFYAEYAAIEEDEVAPVPKGLSMAEAGALAVDGITALQGLEDHLHLAKGQKVLIFGASGGIGHLAVQLAKRTGASILAVASGADGVALVKKLGADRALDGKKDDVARALDEFAPGGLDAALVLTGGPGADAAVAKVRRGGRVAYPNGVEPAPKGPQGVTAEAYNGKPTREAFERLNQLVAAGPFHVELGRTYRLEEAAKAHRELEQHHLGKLAFRIRA